MANVTPVRERYQMDQISIPGELRAYIPGFLERRDQDVAQLRRFLGESDYAPMGTIAHRLKGTGASYGFPALSELGEQLGKAIAERNSSQILDLIEDFAEMVGELKRKL